MFRNKLLHSANILNFFISCTAFNIFYRGIFISYSRIMFIQGL
nr:MAG TPA: hypothetical protein [Caudoviricetes sp.]